MDTLATAEAACDCESTGLNWGPFPSKLGASQLRLFVELFWALLRVTVFGGFQSCEATMRSAFKFEFELIERVICSTPESFIIGPR